MKKNLLDMRKRKLKTASTAECFHGAMTRFMNFDDDYASLQSLFASASQTESVLMVALCSFYSSLAKVVYELRAERGITNRRVGSGALRMGWSKKGAVVVAEAARAPQASKSSKVSSERHRASIGRAFSGVGLEAVQLRGENLAIVKEAIAFLKANGVGLYAGLVEKVVAIDNGVGVLVQWGP